MPSRDEILGILPEMYRLAHLLEQFQADMQGTARITLNEVLNSIDFLRSGSADAFRQHWEDDFRRIAHFLDSDLEASRQELIGIINRFESL